MRYLIAESIALKPHLETGGEIALKVFKEGHSAGFVWLGYELPWSDWNLPKFSHLIGCSLAKRVIKFQNVLSDQGVEVLCSGGNQLEWIAKSQKWASQFSGELKDLKEYTFEGIPLGLGVASSLISYSGNSTYDPKKNLEITKACLASALLVFFRTKKAISEFKPNYVVTFNGRFATAKPIVLAAEYFGIKVLRHERGFNFHHYEIFTDSMHNFSYIKKRILETWEKGAIERRDDIGHEYFHRRRNGDGMGWYSFTKKQQKGMAPDRVLKKLRVVYFSSSDDEFAAVAEENEKGPWKDQIEAVRELISIIKKRTDIELIIRIHPHMSKKSDKDLNQWLALATSSIRVIKPQDPTDSYALLDTADIVFSYGSTMGIEATYWRKPSVLLGPAAYRGTNIVFEPTNNNEIEKLLTNDLEKKIPPQSTCLPYGYYNLTFGIKFKFYKPYHLSDGVFLGERLGWDPWIIYILRRIKASLREIFKY